MSSSQYNVLSINGGGASIIVTLYWLKKFMQQWGVPQEDIWKRFDVITGASAGGIVALALAFGLTIDQLILIFTVQGKSIFSLVPVVFPLTEAIRPSKALKGVLMVANTPFYQSSGLFSESYGHGLLYKVIRDNFKIGDTPATMQDLKTNVIIPSYELDTNRYVLFSNVSNTDFPEFIGENELISNVALATSAAPLYLPALTMNGHNYIDGGVYQNNMSRFGMVLGQMGKKTANKACILSLSPGIRKMGFSNGAPEDPPTTPPADLSAIETAVSLFDIACTGAQESVARALFLESSYTIGKTYAHYFSPVHEPLYFDKTELDNTDTEIQTYYENLADEDFDDNFSDITIIQGHLNG